MSENAAGEILVHDEGRVRVITLNRPDRLNAFTAAGYDLLAAALATADRDPGVHVALVEGAGRAFSSGVDLDAFARGDQAEYVATFGRLLDTLVALEVPLVAAVHGAAVGFGATLLLHCDVVVVAGDARIRFPFAELGTAPEAGSSWLLPATVGRQRAAELLLTARWIDAHEAAALGLAATVAPDAGVAARELAAQIAAHPRPALVAAKQLLNETARAEVPPAVGRETTAGRTLATELGGLAKRPRRTDAPGPHTPDANTPDANVP